MNYGRLSGLFGAAVLVAACGGAPEQQEGELETSLRTPELSQLTPHRLSGSYTFGKVAGNYALEVKLKVNDPRDRVILRADALTLRVKDGRIEVLVDGEAISGLNAVVGADYKIRIVATDDGTDVLVNGFRTGRLRTRAAPPAMLVLDGPVAAPINWVRSVQLFTLSTRPSFDTADQVQPMQRIVPMKRLRRLYWNASNNNPNATASRADTRLSAASGSTLVAKKDE